MFWPFKCLSVVVNYNTIFAICNDSLLPGNPEHVLSAFNLQALDPFFYFIQRFITD